MDFTHLPNKSTYHKIFYASASGATTGVPGFPTGWQIWNKPPNITHVYMYVLGSGGAGAGGRTGGINSGGGGGGGGSSSITIALYPAYLLPDILYVSVGFGRDGAAAGTGGSSGALSYVSTQPSPLGIYVLAQSGDRAAGGGAGGTNTGTGAGAGGSAGTAWTYANYPLNAMGMITSAAGQAGGAGGANTPTNAPNITPLLTVTGGAGGGSTNVGGTTLGQPGNVLGSGFLPTISGGTNENATATIRGGKAGFMGIKPTTESYLNKPMMFTGGSGGGAGGNSGLSGGTGGNGSYGSGGGGGGASYSSTGGSGGRGGDGLVLISCW